MPLCLRGNLSKAIAKYGTRFALLLVIDRIQRSHFIHKIWAASWQNQHNDCAQRRLRSASAQSDQSSLSAWRKVGSLATHWAHSEDDQTEQMPRLICLRWAHSHFVGFVMRWLIFHRRQENIFWLHLFWIYTRSTQEMKRCSCFSLFIIWYFPIRCFN